MISAIIVNYHCVSLTLRAVESILKEKQDVEIWVVDNSVDSSQARQLKQLLPSKVNLIINEYNNGFAQACNQAYQLSRGELILLLNPDAYLVSGCLTVLKRALLSDHKIAAVSPQVYWDDDKKYYLPPSVFPSAWLLLCDELCQLHPLLTHLQSLLFRFKALRVWKKNRGSIQVSALSGGHVLLKRSAIEKSGGLFDEQFFMYYEDSDLMLRLKRVDYCLRVVTGVACIHNYEHNHDKMELMAVSSKQYLSKHYKKSLWLKLIKYLPKNRTFKTWDKDKSLGVFSIPPAFNVPESLQANWLLEISPSPNFIPSIGLLGSGKTAKISSACSQWLHSGRYFCRISAPNKLPIVIQKWQWEKK
jgi:GT2 family glycosyltransferase